MVNAMLDSIEVTYHEENSELRCPQAMRLHLLLLLFLGNKSENVPVLQSVI